MSAYADLHIHTYFSDSTSSPEEVVAQAKAAGLKAIAITDHDAIEGIAPTREAAAKVGIEVISGIELSAEINSRDVHILGYCFNEQNGPLINLLKEMQESRRERIKEMIAKLKTLGITGITFEDVQARSQGKSIGRPHLAQVLVEKQKVKDIKTAFDKYLADGAAAYIPKFKQTPLEAIELINRSGGVAVMAHPMVTSMDEIIPGLVRAGLKGIEVYYPNTTPALLKYYQGIAKKHGLVTTGGSDSHGRARAMTFIGKIQLPYEYVEQLKQKASKN